MSVKRKSLVSLVVVWGLVAVAFVAWLQREAIYDWWRLRGYTPPANIVQLATDTTMNASARKIFYVNHPAIESSTVFSANCGNQDEQTIVLGCYIPVQRGIHVFDVTDARLQGVEQVTAAHEMLHAAYDRLSSDDKKQVDALIQQAYAQVNDQRIRQTIDAYQKAGADTTNELHSILGTEVRDLPPALEQYYKRYFDDRLKIVSYSEQYESVFTSRKDQVQAYDTQLAALKKQIDAAQADLSTQSKQLSDQRSQLDQLLAAKQYSQYNAGVDAYNAAVRDYNAKIDTTKSLVAQYNDTLDKRNAIALEEKQLFQAIDSRTVPDTVSP